jgi:flagellar biosynthesis protein FliQ
MNAELAVELIKNMIFQAITLASPLLIVGMTVGLAISLFQTVTSIQEQTLSFVPKALAIIGVLVVALPWMLRTMMEYCMMLIQKMPDMAR